MFEIALLFLFEKNYSKVSFSRSSLLTLGICLRFLDSMPCKRCLWRLRYCCKVNFLAPEALEIKHNSFVLSSLRRYLEKCASLFLAFSIFHFARSEALRGMYLFLFLASWVPRDRQQTRTRTKKYNTYSCRSCFSVSVTRIWRWRGA